MLFEPSVYRAQDEERLLHEFFAYVDPGKFLDIGANEPSSAVSYSFMKKGWTGMAIDPIPANCEALLSAGYNVWCGAVTTSSQASKGFAKFFIAGGDSGRKSSLNQQLIDPSLQCFEIDVPLKTLAQVISEMNVSHINFVSIDVEGCEKEVVDTLSDDFSLDLLLIEDWARDTKLHRLLVSKGLKRVRRTGYNSWYVPVARDFPVSVWGGFHLIAKLKWFAPIRQMRFERKKRRQLK